MPNGKKTLREERFKKAEDKKLIGNRIKQRKNMGSRVQFSATRNNIESKNKQMYQVRITLFQKTLERTNRERRELLQNIRLEALKRKQNPKSFIFLSCQN